MAGMSKAEEEEQARLERARAAGLFRYMLIREAADPALSSRQRGAMVREIAAREHEGPSGEPVRVTRWTLDVWIRAWRRGGFDALVLNRPGFCGGSQSTGEWDDGSSTEVSGRAA